MLNFELLLNFLDFITFTADFLLQPLFLVTVKNGRINFRSTPENFIMKCFFLKFVAGFFKTS